jgi:type VI secretion system secreted protein VgrG
MHFPLRKGTEVLLAFIDGDPDRPVIAGTVPNPETPSVVNKDNRTRSQIVTAGNNRLYFEDEAGKERILMHSPAANSFVRLGTHNDPGDNDPGDNDPGDYIENQKDKGPELKDADVGIKIHSEKDVIIESISPWDVDNLENEGGHRIWLVSGNEKKVKKKHDDLREELDDRYKKIKVGVLSDGDVRFEIGGDFDKTVERMSHELFLGLAFEEFVGGKSEVFVGGKSEMFVGGKSEMFVGGKSEVNVAFNVEYIAQKTLWTNEEDKLAATRKELAGVIQVLASRHNALAASYSNLLESHNQLVGNHNSLVTNCKQLRVATSALETQVEKATGKKIEINLQATGLKDNDTSLIGVDAQLSENKIEIVEGNESLTATKINISKLKVEV